MNRRALRIHHGRPVDEQGVYNLWLSNYAGGEGTQASPHRYLDYAAYGLFNFLDHSTSQVAFSRLQAFHFGYDAFSDAPNRRPADWGTATEPIVATFTGKTSGWLMQDPHADMAGGRMNGQISRLVRLRGDVELTATLNGDGANGQGTISGAMRGFEFLHNGVWGRNTRYELLPDATRPPAGDPRLGNAVVFESAAIEADGSFTGTAYAAVTSARGFGADNFANGEYGGAFYGPLGLGELEAGGYWRLPMAAGAQQAGAGTIIGSFGAVSESPAN